MINNSFYFAEEGAQISSGKGLIVQNAYKDTERV